GCRTMPIRSNSSTCRPRPAPIGANIWLACWDVGDFCCGMDRACVWHRDWCHVVDRLGGAEAIAASARETKAFRRARGAPGAGALFGLALAYYLRQGGLRSTAAWASAVWLADISNVALLNRLRGCGDWLAVLV